MISIVVDPKPSAMALIGRGQAAERRLELLLAGGAEQIAVFSDAPSPHLAELAAHRLCRRLPSAAELARLALLWVADLPIAEAAPLARAARAGGCLVNVEDVVAFCDFHNPSQVRRGDLLLTVSTAGKSPGLAARIRARLARGVGPRVGRTAGADRREADRLAPRGALARGSRPAHQRHHRRPRLAAERRGVQGPPFMSSASESGELIDQLGCLREAYGAQDGLALLGALLREGPLAGRTALVSSFGAESVVLLDMVATVDPATPVIFLDTGKLFGETRTIARS